MACPFIVEPDSALQDVLYQILDLAGFAVQATQRAEEAFAFMQDHQPSVILLNNQLALMDAPEFIRRYHSLPGPHAPVVVLTSSDEAGEAALAAGAVQYLPRPFEIDDLVNLVEQFSKPKHPPALSAEGSALTLRQWEVAHLIARGYRNEDIARELVITEGTAANHVRHILMRLGFHSRAQIAVWVIQQQNRRNESSQQ